MSSVLSWMCGLACVLAGCSTHVSLGDRPDAGRGGGLVDAGPRAVLGEEFLLDEPTFGTVDSQHVGIAFDGTVYLAAWSMPSGVRAARISAEGEVLDACPLEIAGPELAVTGGRGGPHVAALPTRFAVVWDHADQVYATLVPSDGVPPLVVRAVGTSYLPASSGFTYALTTDGTRFLLAASDLLSDSPSVSVEELVEPASGGLRRANRRATAGVAERPLPSLALAASSTASLLVWETGDSTPTSIVARPAGLVGAGLSEAFSPVTIAGVATDGIHRLSLVGVASVEEHALIVWQEHVGGVAPGQKTMMRLVRLDDASLEAAAQVFADAGATGMARPGNEVFVVSSPIATAWYADPSTTALPRTGSLAGVTDTRALQWFSPRDGASAVVALGLGADQALRVRRIDRTAPFTVDTIDATGALACEPNRQTGLATACASYSDVCVVAWLEDRTSRGEYGVYARRFRRSTGEMIDRTSDHSPAGFLVSDPQALSESLLAPGLPSVCVTSDGHDFLLGWYQSARTNGVATRIVRGTGDPTASEPPHVEPASTRAAPACAWDGRSYVVARADRSTTDGSGVWLRRVAPDGTAIVPSTAPLVSAADVQSELAIASNGHGSVLLWAQGGSGSASGTYAAALAEGEDTLSSASATRVTSDIGSRVTASVAGYDYVFAYQGDSEHAFVARLDASARLLVNQTIDSAATTRHPVVTHTPRGFLVTFDRRAVPVGPWTTLSRLVPLDVELPLITLPALTPTAPAGLSPVSAQGIDVGYVVFYRDAVDASGPMDPAYDPRDRPAIRGRVIVLPPE